MQKGIKKKTYIPNAETLEAMEDVRNNKNLSKSFYSVKELLKELNNGKRKL